VRCQCAGSPALQVLKVFGCGLFLIRQQVIEVIQRQQGLAPGLDNNRLVNLGQHTALARTAFALEVFNRFPTLPFMRDLGVDVVPQR